MEARLACFKRSSSGATSPNNSRNRFATPFFTTKDIGKGTGLGLPMIQGLMAQSGGRLELRSTLGAGTTAELWLPASDEAAVPAPQEEVVGAVPVRALTVLAVDDDFLVLMNTVLMLEDLGHTAVQAQSGKQALQLLDEGLMPDVVVTDHSMPHMTGAELARQISLRYHGLHVILATGYAELPNGEDPGLPRLPKPFSQIQLNQALANILR